MAYFIAITDEDQPIWGAGDTEQSAMAAAAAYGRTSLDPADLAGYLNELVAVECTKAMFDHVRAYGGNCAWEYHGNVAEIDSAYA